MFPAQGIFTKLIPIFLSLMFHHATFSPANQNNKTNAQSTKTLGLLYVYIDFHEPGNGQVFMAHVVYIDFLKILNSVIFWHVYTFLWLWKHFEVHLGNGNVIYALNNF